MTGQQVAHMENICTRFARAFRSAYVRGQGEHGGDVWTKPNMLGEALKEATDQVCYLDVLNQQLGELADALDAGLAGKDAAVILRSMRATDWR
jgi:hypothetical protein